MILHLKGKVDYIDSDGLIFINSFSNFSFQVDYVNPVVIGDDLDIWLYMVLKESEGKMDLRFYGFDSRSRIDDYEKLLNISGVGPKMAFSIIKNIKKEDFIGFIRNSDYKSIKKIPGIGEKLAKRIVLELSRFYSMDDDVLLNIQKKDLSKDQNEVLSTLIQMGFDRGSIINCLNKVDDSLERKDMLKEVLLKLTTNAK